MCRAADWTREARRRQRTRRRQQTLVYHTPIAVHAQFLPLQAELGQRKKKNVRVIKNSQRTLLLSAHLCAHTAWNERRIQTCARSPPLYSPTYSGKRVNVYAPPAAPSFFFVFFPAAKVASGGEQSRKSSNPWVMAATLCANGLQLQLQYVF